jgi:hypothetical protein
VTIPLLMLQLGLLAVVVLWLVLAAATEQRRPGGGTGPASGARPGRRPKAALARAAPGDTDRRAPRCGRGRRALLGRAHGVPTRWRSFRDPAGPGADDSRRRPAARGADDARRTTGDAGAGRDPAAAGAVAARGLEPGGRGDAGAGGVRNGRRGVRHRRPHRADRPRRPGAAGPRGGDAAGPRHGAGRVRMRGAVCCTAAGSGWG